MKDKSYMEKGKQRLVLASGKGAKKWDQACQTKAMSDLRRIDKDNGLQRNFHVIGVAWEEKAN